MGQSMTKGNLIALKGDKRASGKSLVVEGAAKNFISENKSNKVVYVSLSKLSAQKFESKFTEEELKQVASIYGEDSDAEQYLAPIIALKLI
jgi:replicative superfamily II helicase